MCWLNSALFAPLLNNLSVTREIEQTLKRGASTPSTHNKCKVEAHKQKVQKILGTLNPLSSPLDEHFDVAGLLSTVVDPHGTATTSMSESGTYLALLSPVLAGYRLLPDSFFFLNFNALACERLIRRAFAPHELPSLIKAIFSSKDEGDAIRGLLGGDAQTFIDVIDEARSPTAHHPEPVI